MNDINLEDVKQILSKLLNNEMSKEEASMWAFKLREKADKKILNFVQTEDENILWESILFIEGIDLKDSPNSYLHNDEDICDFLKKIQRYSERN